MSNRYLLDTNILVFLVTNDFDEISNDVKNLLEDRSNIFETSALAILEILQLYRIGKVRFKKGQKIEDVLSRIKDELFINIVPAGELHMKTLSGLKIHDGHNDPIDHAIIAQAITDRYTLISSDSKFKHYRDQNLSFVFNKR